MDVSYGYEDIRSIVKKYLSDGRFSCGQVSNGISLSPQPGQDVPSRTNLNCAKRLPMPRAPGGPREAIAGVVGV